MIIITPSRTNHPDFHRRLWVDTRIVFVFRVELVAAIELQQPSVVRQDDLAAVAIAHEEEA